MKDKDKTKEQLITEMDELHKLVAQFEASEVARVQTEKSPLLLDESYQRLFEFFPIGITVLDMKGVILYCNPVVYNKGGYSKDDLVGKHFFRIAPLRARDTPNFVRILASLIRGKIPKPFEVIYQQKGGTTGWTEFSISLIKVGEERRILVVQNDITERKQAEETLRESEERFRTIYENAPVLIDAFDENGRCVLWNKQCCELFGWTIDEINAHDDALALFYPDPAVREEVKQTVTTKPDGRFREWHSVTKAGKTLTTMWANFRLPDGIAFNLGYDITERKRAEGERKELERKAYVSSRLTSIGEMAAGIAHEINNPLTVVIGFAHLLMERKDVPDDVRKALETVHGGSVRVADIVRRLLTFARQDRVEREYVKINDIVENTLALRAYAMKTSNIEIRTYLDPDLPRTMAASGQLQQVFLNIIINAEAEMKRAHGKGSLLIKTEVAGETIRISFKDDGPGIAPEDMDRVFEPFFTTKEPGEGTGLGLSICHGIIAEHRGRLYAKSELGQGATFIVELPVVAVEKEAELAEVAVEGGEKVTGAKILVVDDETGVRELLSQVLTDEGHSVETLDNATDALERIKGERYNLILLDIKLPGMSGVELYENVKGIARTLARRMVFITGDVIAPDTRDFLTRTRVPCITKPFDIEQLKKDISRLLER